MTIQIGLRAEAGRINLNVENSTNTRRSMSCNKLENFVNINCCNQMGERAKFIEIIQSLEALVEEAYEESFQDVSRRGWLKQPTPFSGSTVKKQLDELKQEVE